MTGLLREEEAEEEEGEEAGEEAVCQASLIQQIVQVKDLMKKFLEASPSVRKTMAKEARTNVEESRLAPRSIRRMTMRVLTQLKR